MKRPICISLPLLAAVLICRALMAQEAPGELNQIVGDVDNYRDKNVRMTLRLKRYDPLFEKISFYDSRNHDIEFDLSDRLVKRRLRDSLLDLHEGLRYEVTFTVRGLSPLGFVIGDIVEFRPLLLKLLPEAP